jgi:hypothetical protein
MNVTWTSYDLFPLQEGRSFRMGQQVVVQSKPAQHKFWLKTPNSKVNAGDLPPYTLKKLFNLLESISFRTARPHTCLDFCFLFYSQTSAGWTVENAVIIQECKHCNMHNSSFHVLFQCALFTDIRLSRKTPEEEGSPVGGGIFLFSLSCFAGCHSGSCKVFFPNLRFSSVLF